MCEVVEYKLIKDFPDYMVSSDGKVWSLKHGKMKELKPQTDRGYLHVGLYINGRRVMKRVHRLVSEAFIDNPENLPQVNHKDEVKTNNCVENLEWCTAEFNSNWATRNERMAKARINHPDLSTKVLCIEIGTVYPSVSEASRQTNITRENISKCCDGKRKTAGDFHWQKVE